MMRAEMFTSLTELQHWFAQDVNRLHAFRSPLIPSCQSAGAFGYTEFIYTAVMILSWELKEKHSAQVLNPIPKMNAPSHFFKGSFYSSTIKLYNLA